MSEEPATVLGLNLIRINAIDIQNVSMTYNHAWRGDQIRSHWISEEYLLAPQQKPKVVRANSWKKFSSRTNGWIELNDSAIVWIHFLLSSRSFNYGEYSELYKRASISATSHKYSTTSSALFSIRPSEQSILSTAKWFRPWEPVVDRMFCNRKLPHISDC